MEKINIMLCCGAGMSSGFLAQKARKEAKKRKLDVKVEARSETEAVQYLSEIDVLLLGPHLENMLEDLKQIAVPYNVPVAVIPQSIYGKLDGAALLDFAIEQVK